jgi:hypothetical protein
MQVKTIKNKIGDAVLQVDNLPTKIKVKEKDFSEDAVAR